MSRSTFHEGQLDPLPCHGKAAASTPARATSIFSETPTQSRIIISTILDAVEQFPDAYQAVRRAVLAIPWPEEAGPKPVCT
ncbi:MAG: hypothetical protein FJW39_33615 [Acidobacteria bacterium]|nr:hypothetical protein [Acidobacteriota bacterium]